MSWIGALLLFALSVDPIFESHTDIGPGLHPGSLVYDPASRTYTISGSGENMWFASDAFHFVWKKVSGDVTLSADIAILGQGGDPHRKAVLMIRQELDPDSAYADAALHGDGLTSLQSREAKGAATHEIQAGVKAPARLRLSKRGDYFHISTAPEAGAPLQPAGGWMKVPLREPFYVGLGVCAHNKDVVEKAVFSNVELTAATSSGKPQLFSTLETITVSSTDRRVAYLASGRIETPLWTPDGSSLLFTDNGKLRRVPSSGGQPEDLPFSVTRFYGISPDGKRIAFTSDSQSRVYLAALPDGKPERLTKNSPSRFHAWSPDGNSIIFSGERQRKSAILNISAEEGKETLLISGPGVYDNPEYSPDSRYIYFNSNRDGSMQIWRVHSDGIGQEQITSDDMSSWFPHPSPDGKSLAFLSAPAASQTPPRDAEVLLRVMSLADRKIKLLGRLTGGEGSFELPSWSPDSRRLAFVSYQFF